MSIGGPGRTATAQNPVRQSKAGGSGGNDRGDPVGTDLQNGIATTLILMAVTLGIRVLVTLRERTERLPTGLPGNGAGYWDRQCRPLPNRPVPSSYRRCLE